MKMFVIEAGARLVDIAQACFVDETVQCIAPRKIGLKQLAARCAILPRWVSEALVAGCWADWTDPRRFSRVRRTTATGSPATIGSLTMALSKIAALSTKSLPRRPTSGLAQACCGPASLDRRIRQRLEAGSRDWSAARHAGFAVLGAQRLLVEFAHARLGQGVNEQDHLRNGEFRYHPLVAEGENVSLYFLFGNRRPVFGSRTIRASGLSPHRASLTPITAHSATPARCMMMSSS